MGSDAGNELERNGAVLCRQSQPPELYLADALAGWLRASLGRAYRSGTTDSRGLLVWHAELGGNRLQRLQTRSLGMASQQNARGASRGAALARDGCGSSLDAECGHPSGRGIVPEATG